MPSAYRFITARTAALFAIMASTTIASPSYAQQPKPDPSSSSSKAPKGLEQPPASEGYEAYQAGDYSTAIAKLEAARQTDPSGPVLHWLGNAYAADGQTVKAVDTFELALAASDTPMADKDKAAVNAKLEELRGQIATVSVSSPVSGATIIIDGAAPQPLPISDLRMSAGLHTFKVQAADHEAVERTLTLQGGGQAQLELAPTKTEAPPPPPPPAPPAPVAPPPSDDGNTALIMRTAGIGTAVLGALAAGIGVASLINAQSLRESTADDKLAHDTLFGSDCSLGDYTACYVSGLAINENAARADNFETLGIAMTIGGGVLIAGGVVIYALAPTGSSQEKAASLSIQCGPFGLGGLSCKGRF